MRSIIITLILALGAAALAANVFLGDLAEDDSMRDARVFDEQVAGYRAAAESGNAVAQYNLGLVYLTAKEELRDRERAIDLFRKAAAQGHTGAQYQLGQAYEHGIGVAVDFAAAASWYAKAVRVKEYPPAQLALGMMYFHGRGVGHDEIQAARWIRRAAMNNEPVAQFLMGRIYETGFSVRSDPIEAYKWYALSARLADAVIAYDPRFKPGAAMERLAKTMNRSQIEAATRAVADWRPAS